MSTKSSIKYRLRDDETPGFHLYDDLMDSFSEEPNPDPPVYLEIEGVHVSVETLNGGKAVVTLTLPRELARTLGLLPAVPPNRK